MKNKPIFSQNFRQKFKMILLLIVVMISLIIIDFELINLLARDEIRYLISIMIRVPVLSFLGLVMIRIFK